MEFPSGGVNNRHLLRIALRHLDDFGRDLMKLTAPLLPAAPAVVAAEDGDLVIGPSLVARTRMQQVSEGHRSHELVVGQALPDLLAHMDLH